MCHRHPDAKIRHGSHRIASKPYPNHRAGSDTAFQGIGRTKPLIEAPKGGTNILFGIGSLTNGNQPPRSLGEVDAGATSMRTMFGFSAGMARASPTVRARIRTTTRTPRIRPSTDAGQPVSEPLGNGRCGGTFLTPGRRAPSPRPACCIQHVDRRTHLTRCRVTPCAPWKFSFTTCRTGKYMRFRRRRSEARAALRSPLDRQLIQHYVREPVNLSRHSMFQPFPYAIENCGLEEYQISNRTLL